MLNIEINQVLRKAITCKAWFNYGEKPNGSRKENKLTLYKNTWRNQKKGGFKHRY